MQWRHQNAGGADARGHFAQTRQIVEVANAPALLRLQTVELHRQRPGAGFAGHYRRQPAARRGAIKHRLRNSRGGRGCRGTAGCPIKPDAAVTKRQRPGQHDPIAPKLAAIDDAGFDFFTGIDCQPDRLGTDCCCVVDQNLELVGWRVDGLSKDELDRLLSLVGGYE